MVTDETFEAALKRYIGEGGYSLDNVRDQVRISKGLDISVPFLTRLVQGEADVTDALAAKLAAFFRTDAKYWSQLPKKRNRPQIVEGVPYEQDLPKEVTEAAKWPHAEYAAQLAREYFPSSRLIEIKPTLFMGAVQVKNEDLIRVFDVYYIEEMEDSGFTLWVGKRVRYQRPHKHSGKWSLRCVEPLRRTVDASAAFGFGARAVRSSFLSASRASKNGIASTYLLAHSTE
jgi:hypothetical protein